MNDYSETRYGQDLLINSYNSTAAGVHLKTNLNKIRDGITNTIEESFNQHVQRFALDTHITCFSEHLDTEDVTGRLSMWRAYSGTTGVALVINNPVFLNPPPGLNVYSTPVAYLTREQFEIHTERIAENIIRDADFVRTLDSNTIVGLVFNMLRFAILGTKHPGFAEEKEWRIVHTPSFEPSEYLVKELRAVRGLPQCIYKMPLKDIPEVGYFGEISELVDRIIIGPTQYPIPLFEAFAELLTGVGVKRAEKKVCRSDIPLRT
jgi:hypothetical protein